MRYQSDNIELEPSFEYQSDDCGDATAQRYKEGDDALSSGSDDSSGASNRWRFKKKKRVNQIAINE